MFNTRLSSVLILVFFFFSFQKSYSQCFEIESILVDACDDGSNEGLNEMVRFKVGNNSLNTSTMSVVWPSNTWRNLLLDPTKVALMNTQILAAGGCGRLIEPVGGILPANSEVILITSYNFTLSLNVFGAINQNIYILFQNNPTSSSGHFANYSTAIGPRTLSINFGASCSDSVTYERSLLVNINGTYGPAFPDPLAAPLNNGSTVNFNPSGSPTYVNNGCVAPVPVFSVDAGTTPITDCSGSTISLIGTAQGQQSVAWSAPSGTFSNPTSVNSTYTIASGATGPITITLTATNPSSCIANITDTVTLNIGTISAPIIDSITQPTCATATGSAALSGLPSGNWTLNPGGITGSSTTTTVSNLATGTINYTVTNAANCTSSASAIVVINAQPSNPSAPIIGLITQPTCASATGNVALSGLPSGNWTLNPGGITGSSTTTTVSNLATGTINYTVTNAANCTSSASAIVVINAQPSNPSPPIIDSISQPTCTTSTGSVALSGLPSGNWSLNPGGISGSSTTTTIANLTSETINYTVTNAANCTSSASAIVVINAQPSNPTAPIIDLISQPTCATATGSAALSGLPSGSWTLNPGGITGSSTTTTVSNLATGTINYTVTNAANCTSSASANVVINAQPLNPTAPIIDSITQPTCATATGSVALSGLPSGNWTLIPGGITGSSITTTVSNLTTGTINYTVTNAANCTSSASANVVINAQPLNPSAPIIGLITQPTCATAKGSVALSGLPSGNWTLNPGGRSGSSTTTTVSNLATGTINYTVTNAANCTSSASANVVINAQPLNPSAPIIGLITQPTCATATGSVALSGLPSGNWTLNPGGITGSSTTTTVSNLATGTTNYTVTNAANCSSSASANVVINNQPATANPVFTPISPICFGTNITLPIISNNGISGTWSPLFNPTISTTYTFTPNGGQCLNPTTLQIEIIPLPKPIINDGVICIDAAGVTFHSYFLNTGLNALDYSFQWSLNGSTIATTTTTFEAFAAGFYTVVATNLVNGCSSLPTSATVFESNPATSFTAAVTSLYFSENATISATAIGGNGIYQFSLDYGLFQTSPIFENVVLGEHTISIKDTNECTNLLPVTLNTIGYPTYFTPNGDGFHDYWNIIGLENQPTAKVYIFDKYGKLIKQISTKSLGWDGTYNGNPVPSSDYWFTIEYLEPAAKTYKAHFSLKR
jgi:gliding motility-associated-like protein